MKLNRIVLLGALLLGVTPLLKGQVSSNSLMSGSVHDLTKSDYSGKIWNGTGEICIECHTPHYSNTDPNTGSFIAPLWNHVTTTTSFPVYTGSDHFNTLGLRSIMGQPTGASKLCLSCHDGQTAINDFTGTFSNGAKVFGGNYQHAGTASGADYLGYWAMQFGATSTAGGSGAGKASGLAATHPISFVYGASLHTADNTINDPTVTLSNITASGTIDADMLDKNHQLQCTSCHEIHQSSSSVIYLLRINNSGSALCFTCHNK
jgi:predicted CXXCH cytochrome family protein